MIAEESERTPETCPACGGTNPPGAKFCDSCGVSLAAGRRARRPSERIARQRREVALGVHRALVSARRQLVLLRQALVFVALLPLVLGAVLLIGGAGAAAAVLLGFGAVMLAGALFVAPRAPLMTAVGAAGLWSLCVVLEVATGRLPGIVDISLLVALWGSVPPIARAVRIVNEHGDELGDGTFRDLSARKVRRRRGAAPPPSEAREHAVERQRGESRRWWRACGIVASAMVAVALLGWFGYSLHAEGESLDARLETFVAAWRADDKARIEAMMPAERQREYWPKVERILRREGWFEDLPRIEAPQIDQRSDEFAVVRFELERGGISTGWRNVDGLWKLDRIVFRELR
ncbi:MAG: hypothetical protein IPM29_21100 [Planctomycetes bacterium]|nr:hypothetical protein [Planctomycetota bacterium]